MTLPRHFRTMKQLSLWGLAASAAGVACLLILGKANEISGRMFLFALTCPGLLCAVRLIWASSRLEVAEDGITVRDVFWRQHIRWENLQRFKLVDFDGIGMGITPDWARYAVGYVVSEEQRQALPRWYLIFHRFYDCHGSLPPVTGMSADELLRLLNGALADFRYRGYDREGAA